MKFIIDAQLPKSLSDFLKSKGYDSIHTLDLSEKNKTLDDQITKIALEENRIVVSKDVDFLESFLIKSQPKKLIIVRTGNISNKELIALFNLHLDLILSMISRSDLIEISTTEIAEHS